MDRKDYTNRSFLWCNTPILVVVIAANNLIPGLEVRVDKIIACCR